MSAAFLVFLICVFAGPLHQTLMGAFFTVLHDKVDFARRQFATRRILATRPAGYLLLTGHGKGPWGEVGGAIKHALVDPVDFAENIFHPSSDA